MNLIDTAEQLLKNGFSVIPSGSGDTGKSPCIKWKDYQSKLPTIGMLHEWERTYKPAVWGIVTGEISGITVFDADNKMVAEIFARCGISPHIKTKKGYHYYFRYEKGRYTTTTGLIPGLDVRSDGGFVNCIGGNDRAAYTVISLPTKENLHSLSELPTEITNSMNNKSFTEKQYIGSGDKNGLVFGQGGRNNGLTSIAGRLHQQGLTKDAILSALLTTNRDCCNPPLPENEVEIIVNSITRYVPYPNDIPLNIKYSNVTNLTSYETGQKRDKNVTPENEQSQNVTPVSKQIIEWIETSRGWFTNEDIDREFNLRMSHEKDNRRKILSRLRTDGKIINHGNDSKKWRKVAGEVHELNYKDYPSVPKFDINLPLGLNKLVNLYRGNLVVIAGVTNAGKTALLFELLKLNTGKNVRYLYTEGGADEIASRLDNCPDMERSQFDFKAFDPYETGDTEIVDHIDPDAINVIDYLEINNDFFEIAQKLADIQDAVNDNGLAIVAIQKNTNREYGYGGMLSAQKARLYLSLDQLKPTIENLPASKVSIVKAKSWANNSFNPNGLKTRIVVGAGWIVEPDVEWVSSSRTLEGEE
jgi:hypothetical protein